MCVPSVKNWNPWPIFWRVGVWLHLPEVSLCTGGGVCEGLGRPPACCASRTLGRTGYAWKAHRLVYRGTSLIRNNLLGPFCRPLPGILGGSWGDGRFLLPLCHSTLDLGVMKEKNRGTCRLDLFPARIRFPLRP